MNPILLGLFKTLQDSQRKRETRRGRVGDLFEQGFRPRDGGSGFEEGAGGVTGFLQQLVGGGPRIDYSQFEAPPALIGTPGGGVTSVPDKGRRPEDASQVVPGRTTLAPGSKAFDDEGNVVADNPKVEEKWGVRDARQVKDDKGTLVGWEVGQYNMTTGKFAGTMIPISQTKDSASPLRTLKLPDGTQAVFDPNTGAFTDPGGGSAAITDSKRFQTPEDRDAGDISAAVKSLADIQAMLNQDGAFSDLELDADERRKLESLRSELIHNYPDINTEGLDLKDVSAGAADRIANAKGEGKSDGPIRILKDVLKDIDETLDKIWSAPERNRPGRFPSRSGG